MNLPNKFLITSEWTRCVAYSRQFVCFLFITSTHLFHIKIFSLMPMRFIFTHFPRWKAELNFHILNLFIICLWVLQTWDSVERHPFLVDQLQKVSFQHASVELTKWSNGVRVKCFKCEGEWLGWCDERENSNQDKSHPQISLRKMGTWQKRKRSMWL